MPTTTDNGFDTVSQSGTGVSWTGVTNLPYPTHGEASVDLNASNVFSNRVYFYDPYEDVNIPTGAEFVSMSFNFQAKKTGIYSSGTTVNFTVHYKDSTEDNISTKTLSADESWKSFSVTGDDIYWGRDTTLSDMISRFKDGSSYIRIIARLNTGVPCTVKLKDVTVQITYTAQRGELASMITTFA